jgi:hypothetical protein
MYGSPARQARSDVVERNSFRSLPGDRRRERNEFRSTTRQALAMLLAGPLVVSLSGCGGKDEVRLVPVAGKVTKGKEPLIKGDVILHPDATKGNKSMDEPRGSIDADGNFKIYTHRKEGAAPGWYQVAVTAADQPDPNNPYKFTFLVPQRYIDHRTSQLAFEVVANPEPDAYDLKLDAR